MIRATGLHAFGHVISLGMARKFLEQAADAFEAAAKGAGLANEKPAADRCLVLVAECYRLMKQIDDGLEKTHEERKGEA